LDSAVEIEAASEAHANTSTAESVLNRQRRDRCAIWRRHWFLDRRNFYSAQSETDPEIGDGKRGRARLHFCRRDEFAPFLNGRHLRWHLGWGRVLLTHEAQRRLQELMSAIVDLVLERESCGDERRPAFSMLVERQFH
jgi:hypothetical protein